MHGPSDEPTDETLPPVRSVDSPKRQTRLRGLLFDPARNAEWIIAIATGCAIVGLSLPVLTGFDRAPTVFGTALGLLFLSFLALFYSAICVSTAGGPPSEDRPPR